MGDGEPDEPEALGADRGGGEILERVPVNQQVHVRLLQADLIQHVMEAGAVLIACGRVRAEPDLVVVIKVTAYAPSMASLRTVSTMPSVGWVGSPKRSLARQPTVHGPKVRGSSRVG
ncbi:hypothetical protein ACFQ1L_33335 [Phytohabitans flavus]|uniref:hypothetical protein n=1 Tax=Phytohabitans flavus TaxID=1076124 RepID=UPI00156652B2|nr:hypothetical protein [Phytohabitans flavus]